MACWMKLSGLFNVKKNIAILFPNLRGNVGDYAILYAMLIDIRNHYPNYTVHIYPKSGSTIDHQMLNAFVNSGAPEFQLRTLNSPKIRIPRYCRLLILLRVWPIIHKYLIYKVAESSDLNNFKDYSAIFIAGGAQWSSSNLAVQMFGALLSVAKFNKYIYMYPFSLTSRITKHNAHKNFNFLLSNIKPPLLVRDRNSQRIIDSIGLESKLGVDSVFSLREISRLIEPAQSRNKNRILIIVTGNDETLYSELDYWLQNGILGDLEVNLLTTCYPEDGSGCELIQRNLGVPFYAPLTWQEVVAEMKSSKIIITNRLHGMILGTFSDALLVPLLDREKIRSFVNDAKLPLSISRVEQIPDLVRNINKSIEAEQMNRVNEYSEQAKNKKFSPIIL
jgi:polysaccharide pyruvyl transferase WcaK-like protein